MSTSDESDKFVVLIASLIGGAPVRRRVRKDVIKSESSFLKEHIQAGSREIKIPLKRPKNLKLILEYLYEGQLTVSSGNHLESLWNDARILGLVNLQKVCVQRLTDTIAVDSWFQILKFSQTDGCDELEANVLSFVNDNFENCSSSSTFKSLNVDQMIQMLQLPTVKTTVTESKRVALILDWIKVNEVDRCPQAHRLLEQVDLMKLTEDSLHSFFDEESAFRNWRSVAIFERAIRLKKIEETARHSNTVQGQPDESELVQADPNVTESGDERLIINIKQEVVAPEESPSDAEVNESCETVNTEESVRECRIRIKREVSLPLPSSVGENIDNVENNEDGPPPLKMPRRQYSQNETESVIPSPPIQTDFVSKQKQVLYFSKLSNGATSLNFVITSAGFISQPQQVLASLPNYIHGIPKLIWVEEARHFYFLGFFGTHGRKVPFFNYMNGKGAPKVTLLPKMLYRRHNNYQPVLLNGCIYVFGGSKSDIYKNKDRLSSAEALDMKTKAPINRWNWQPVASMATQRDLYASACVEGVIYVTGGAIDRPKEKEPRITDHTVCYVPGEDRWKQLPPMRNFRCGHALAVLGHKIYVFGGRGNNLNGPCKDLVNMKSAEVYDAHNFRWTLIAPMLRPRYGGSAVEIEGKIYVIGGDKSKEGESRSSVECYDPVTNSWTLVSESVDDEGLFNSITVIDDPECFLKGS